MMAFFKVDIWCGSCLLTLELRETTSYGLDRQCWLSTQTKYEVSHKSKSNCWMYIKLRYKYLIFKKRLSCLHMVMLTNNGYMQ